MSVEALTLALHHSKASGAAKVVLLGIANHQGDSGAWPAVATLAKYAQVSERRVQQILSELQATGELIIEPQAGGYGQYKTNRYWINITCDDDCDGSTAHRPGVKSDASGVKSSAVRGEVWSQSGVKSASPKPLREPKRNQRDLVQVDIEKAFEDFWAVYPRRVAKANAYKSFTKAIETELPQTLIDGARRLRDDPYLPPMQFVPHPATWINREGWLDEPYPPRELTPEEKAARAAAESQRKREAEIRHTALIRAEAEEAAKNAAPPPKCEHGNSIVSCVPCRKKITTE